MRLLGGLIMNAAASPRLVAALLDAPGVALTARVLLTSPFWIIPDPMARFHDMNAFIANLGLIGGLVLAAILAEGRRP